MCPPHRPTTSGISIGPYGTFRTEHVSCELLRRSEQATTPHRPGASGLLQNCVKSGCRLQSLRGADFATVVDQLTRD